jgi:hypothetical protein
MEQPAVPRTPFLKPVNLLTPYGGIVRRDRALNQRSPATDL